MHMPGCFSAVNSYEVSAVLGYHNKLTKSISLSLVRLHGTLLKEKLSIFSFL